MADFATMKRLNLRALTHVSLMVGTVVGVLVFTGTSRDAQAHGSHEPQVFLAPKYPDGKAPAGVEQPK